MNYLDASIRGIPRNFGAKKKFQIPKNGKNDASIGELNPKRLNQSP